MANNDAPIIIKRVKKGGGEGHHGGAWKVAYADFVTAMMAFFLLMWLINTTTPEQKRGIADYFAPASLSRTTSGSGGIMGGTVFGEEGARSGGSVAVVMRMSPPNPGGQAADGQSDANAQSDSASEDAGLSSGISEQDKREFERAEVSLRQAMQDLPDFAELSKHIMIDQTPEGLRIQIVDQEGRPMFAPGGSEPLDRTQRLLREVAQVIMKLPNRITISGHTDGAPFERADGYSNWELSSDRANAARRVLMEAGVPADRIFQVSGKAGSEPLLPDDPFASSNRRISIVLLGEAPPLPPGYEP
ncbi:MAG: flagellar motor protein MotB [Alphaproteobacteria bacterium]|nr:flagellar motor protein MotB [Alphaproteobacteria bacterium]